MWFVRRRACGVARRPGGRDPESRPRSQPKPKRVLGAAGWDLVGLDVYYYTGTVLLIPLQGTKPRSTLQKHDSIDCTVRAQSSIAVLSLTGGYDPLIKRLLQRWSIKRLGIEISYSTFSYSSWYRFARRHISTSVMKSVFIKFWGYQQTSLILHTYLPKRY